MSYTAGTAIAGSRSIAPGTTRHAARGRADGRRAQGAAMMTLLAVSLAAFGVGLNDLGLLQRDGPHVNTIGDDVSSSFGVVAVAYVRSVGGVTNRALAGSSHGVSGLVTSKQQRIQVAVSITNRSNLPINHKSSQFTLLVTQGGKTRSLKPAAGNLPDMRVLPHAGIEGHLGFTLPLKPVTLTLQYRDPGRAQPIVIDLGDFTSRPGTTEHH